MSHPDQTAAVAVQRIYDAHHSWLFGWLRRRLGNSADAADLAQDTFVGLLSSYRRRAMPDLQEPRAYLTTIAKRLMVDLYRRHALEQAYLDALASMPTRHAPSEEQRLVVLQTLREVDALLAALPDKVRIAFLLSQLDGLTYEQIGAEMGVSVRTVKRYMADAFKHCILAEP
ncbi:RNA polymerase subunit sigma [Achromobacter insolitus]|uniref:sigma-70 family RNA polymerase sigma factor n=1 Tax=Achromobacter insolitus TaxID=217204 RepID=UPI0007C77018|nr:sigma-70 family RNA polymerase sigma factor [Achromobacter insolitus]AXA71279.1 RNA polymerase subunit sigma [Achromobacter insolitus]OAE61761.1 RNA polymerase subunit sigma [Achromobacter insolitus]OCZ58007.1 RNA polymerase subunit sigma [Achromobacter insolitus]